MIDFNTKNLPKPFNPRKKAFLKAYSKCGMIGQAAKIANVSLLTVSNWRKTDTKFFEQFQVAQLKFLERLESEADRRAVKGVEEPIYNKKGELVGHKVKYSDSLLMFRLKALAPQKYRERFEADITDEQLDSAIERQLARMATRGQAQISGPSEDGDGGSDGGSPQGPIVGEILPP